MEKLDKALMVTSFVSAAVLMVGILLLIIEIYAGLTLYDVPISITVVSFTSAMSSFLLDILVKMDLNRKAFRESSVNSGVQKQE